MAARSDEGILKSFLFQLHCIIAQPLTHHLRGPPLPLGEGFFSFVCLIFSFYLREKVAARPDEGIPQNFPFQLNCTITKTLTHHLRGPPSPAGRGISGSTEKAMLAREMQLGQLSNSFLSDLLLGGQGPQIKDPRSLHGHR